MVSHPSMNLKVCPDIVAEILWKQGIIKQMKDFHVIKESVPYLQIRIVKRILSLCCEMHNQKGCYDF